MMPKQITRKEGLRSADIKCYKLYMIMFILVTCFHNVLSKEHLDYYCMWNQEENLFGDSFDRKFNSYDICGNYNQTCVYYWFAFKCDIFYIILRLKTRNVIRSFRSILFCKVTRKPNNFKTGELTN